MPSIELSHYGRRREQLLDDVLQVHTDIINKTEQLNSLFQVWNDRASHYTRSRFAEPVVDSFANLTTQHTAAVEEMELLSKQFAQLGSLWNVAYTFDAQYSQIVEELSIQKQKVVDVERKSVVRRQSSEEAFINARRQLEKAEKNQNVL